MQTVFHLPAVYGGLGSGPEGHPEAVLQVVRRVARGGEAGDPERVDVDLDARAGEHVADGRRAAGYASGCSAYSSVQCGRHT